MSDIKDFSIPIISAPLWSFDEDSKCVKIRSIFSQRVFLNPEKAQIFINIDGNKTISEIANLVGKATEEVITLLQQLEECSIVTFQSEEDSIWA